MTQIPHQVINGCTCLRQPDNVLRYIKYWSSAFAALSAMPYPLGCRSLSVKWAPTIHGVEVAPFQPGTRRQSAPKILPVSAP
jgi:hypothetical protein